MMIHDSVDASDVASVDARNVRPPGSPARLLAEAVWYLLWHSGAAALAAGRFALLARAIGRERRALDALDDAGLSDIGIDRATARIEASRAWSDLPRSRR